MICLYKKHGKTTFFVSLGHCITVPNQTKNRDKSHNVTQYDHLFDPPKQGSFSDPCWDRISPWVQRQLV